MRSQDESLTEDNGIVLLDTAISFSRHSSCVQRCKSSSFSTDWAAQDINHSGIMKIVFCPKFSDLVGEAAFACLMGKDVSVPLRKFKMTALHSFPITQQRSHTSCLPMPRPRPHGHAVTKLGVSCGPLETLIGRFTSIPQGRRNAAESRLLKAIENTERGLVVSPSSRQEISDAVDELEDIGQDTVTTGRDLSATWKLLYTTEKASGCMNSCQVHGA